MSAPIRHACTPTPSYGILREMARNFGGVVTRQRNGKTRYGLRFRIDGAEHFSWAVPVHNRRISYKTLDMAQLILDEEIRPAIRQGVDPLAAIAPYVLAPADASDRSSQVRAFLVKYYGTAVGQSVRSPLATVTTTDRFALVEILGEPYRIVDIGMRMLQPVELFRAQGFPDSYRITDDGEGNAFTKTEQVRLAGNSVCPPVARAVVGEQVAA